MLNENIFGKFKTIEPLIKGQSIDKKYFIKTKHNENYLLRVIPFSSPRFEIQKWQYSMVKSVADLNIPMCIPIELGNCDEGIYWLQSWIDGYDLEVILPILSIEEQYNLGIKAGQYLKKVHSLSAPNEREDWEILYNDKTEKRINKYKECGVRFSGDTYALKYIEENKQLLRDRPQSFRHSDFHVRNMMIKNGELNIIDFACSDYGDPWEEFNRLIFSVPISSYFATGQLRGYFGGEPPMDFFRLLSFYMSCFTLAGILWATSVGKREVELVKTENEDILSWFNNMKNPIPTWYHMGACF